MFLNHFIYFYLGFVYTNNFNTLKMWYIYSFYAKQYYFYDDNLFMKSFFPVQLLSYMCRVCCFFKNNKANNLKQTNN